MTPRFDAVFWDHDGLLVDTEQLFFRVTRELLADAGAELDEQFWSAEYLSKGGTTTSIGVSMGIEPERMAGLVVERNRRYRQLLKGAPPLRPGVAETLSLLAEHLPMVLVTGSRREDIETVHRHSGILKFFRVVITREDYCLPKPSPEPYIEAARQVRVTPDRALAVEDSERGMIAALSAGMTCIVVPGRLTRNQQFVGALAVEETVASVPSHVFASPHE